MKHTVCISGCGGIAQVHAQVLSRMPNITVAACADIIPEKAQEMAARLHCRAYTSTEEMLEKEHPDAVHLCTPHYLHTPHALFAAQRGIAVFTEKPPVISFAQLEALEDAAGQVPIGVCFQNRFKPSVQLARKLLREEAYGPLLGLRAMVTWNRPSAYYEGNWRGTWETEGGCALINQAIHSLDLLVYLLGKPDITEATMCNHHLRGVIEAEDTVQVYLKKDNIPALLYASTAFSGDLPVQVDLHTGQGILRLQNNTLQIILPDHTECIHCPEDETLGKDYWGAGHKKCIEEFYACLEGRKPPSCSLALCRDTLECMLHIYDSCKNTLS